MKDKAFSGPNREYYSTTYPDADIDPLIDDKGWYQNDKKETREEAMIRVAKILTWIHT